MIKILYDRVLIKAANAEEVTTGGIVLAKAIEESHEGVVVAVGEGKKNKQGVIVPMNVKIDDRVLYDISKGIAISVNGEKYLALREENILAVMDADK